MGSGGGGGETGETGCNKITRAAVSRSEQSPAKIIIKSYIFLVYFYIFYFFWQGST